MKNLYQGLEIELVALEREDIVTLSDNVQDDIFKPKTKAFGFTPDDEVFN